MMANKPLVYLTFSGSAPDRAGARTGFPWLRGLGRPPDRRSNGPVGAPVNVVRRRRPQISDLGAQPLARGTRRGSVRSVGKMTGSGGSAGGPVRHTPVLGRRSVDWLGVRDGGLYVDATFG